jgi:hypothetical protein
MRKNTIAAVLFSEQLNELLMKKYGSVPSAAALATQFNLRAHGTKTITREAARKWLRGMAMPEMSKLTVLVDWLCLDINKIFKSSIGQTLSMPELKISIPSQELHDLHTVLFEIAQGLPQESAKALLMAAWVLRDLHERSPSGFTAKNFNELVKSENKHHAD